MILKAGLPTGGSTSVRASAQQYWHFAGRALRMVLVSIGHSRANAVRVRAVITRAAQNGMAMDQQFWGKDMTQGECRIQMKQLNDAVDVYAVLLLPDAPAHIDVFSLRGELKGHKDLMRPGAWHHPGPVRPGEVDCVLNSAISAHQAHSAEMKQGGSQIAR